MKVILSGGGISGGHTTPLIAVAEALKEQDSDIQLLAVVEKTAGAKPLRADISTNYILSGKYRRYYGESLLTRITDWRTWTANVIDIIKVMAGFIQSLWLLIREKPDVIFIKGGYVSVPLGFAARLLDISYITHDSDTIPGLTNRLLAGGAKKNLVGFPVDFYSYQPSKMMHVGVPIRQMFDEVDRVSAREKLGIAADSQRIIIVGGGNGARNINRACAAVAPELADLGSVLHVSGRGNQYQETKKLVGEVNNYQVIDFLTDTMALELAAADVVISRAGSTALAELAALKATVIAIPNPLLTDGHQLRNGQALEESGAAIVIDEQTIIDQPQVIPAATAKLINDPKKQQWLGGNLHKLFPDDAAKQTAEVLIDVSTQ